jgi:hypothetical protein
MTVLQAGAGQTSFVATGGVSLGYTPGLKIAAQFGAATVLKVGVDTWYLFGNLIP